jgi:hypothetical protein
MNMVSLQDVANVLRQYSNRYRWLDVFTHQVRELRSPSQTQFWRIDNNHYYVDVGTERLELRIYPEKGVVRFSLAGRPEAIVGAAITGAALGALVGAGVRSSTGPEGVILGLLLGGLIGAAVGNAAIEAAKANENRIMTLRYEPRTEKWQVYHGPYVQWAKEALRPG